MSSASTPAARARRWTPFDRLLAGIIALCGAVTALFVLLAPRFLDPQEDAIILFQYSRNLAQNGAISYIPHGPHVEGATDFLLMVMIALGMKLGMNPAWVVSVLNFLALAVIVYLVLRIARVPLRPPPALFVAGTVGLMPQIFAALTGFSVLPFAALLLCLLWTYLQRNDAAMAIAALVLCLFRPDGVVFALPFLAAALFLHAGKARRASLFALLFVLPGCLYFAWRWHYFGEMLPLPFLVKSDAVRLAHTFVTASVWQAKPLLTFTIIVLAVALWRRMDLRENRVVLLCFLIIPTLFYLSMRLDQDIGRRFFIYLPIGATALIAMNWPAINARAATLLRVGVVAWLVFMQFTMRFESQFAWKYESDNRRYMVEEFAHLPKGRLLVSEAGMSAFYSGWETYDAWGLNTAEFAHRLLQPADVARLHPDAILTYTNTNPEDCVRHDDWQTPYTTREWSHLTRNLVTGADPAHYDLRVAPVGSISWRQHEHVQPWEVMQECWFLRKDSPLHDQLDAILRRHDATTLAEYEAHAHPATTNSTAAPTVQATAPAPQQSLPRRAAGRVWRTARAWWMWAIV